VMGSGAVRKERVYSTVPVRGWAGQLIPNRKFGACVTAQPSTLREGVARGHADILAIPPTLSTYTIRVLPKRGGFMINDDVRETRG